MGECQKARILGENKMTNDEIDFSANSVAEGEEIQPSDLQARFIKNPKVGESIVLAIAKIVKNTNTKFKAKDGTQINKALSGVNYNYNIVTTDDKVYTLNIWEVKGKLWDIMRELNKTKGFTVKITHLKDGKIGKKGTTNYDVTLISKTA